MEFCFKLNERAYLVCHVATSLEVVSGVIDDSYGYSGRWGEAKTVAAGDKLEEALKQFAAQRSIFALEGELVPVRQRRAASGLEIQT